MQDRSLIIIDCKSLMLEQRAIGNVCNSADVKGEKRAFRNGNHVVKAKQPKRTAVELIQMRTGFQIYMIRLRRFHRNEVAILADEQDDANIRAAAVFVELYAVVTGMQKMNVMIGDTVDVQIRHESTFPAKKKRGCVARPAFQLPMFFKSLLNGKGFPLF